MDTGVRETAQDPAFAKLLARIAADTGSEVTLRSPNAFELLLEGDYPARVTVHPRGDRVVIDIYLYNASMVTGVLRASLVQSLLLLNHAGARGRRFAVGLDNRDFVLLTAARPLDAAIVDDFAGELAYLAAQAARIRAFVEQVTFAGAEAPVELSHQTNP